MLGEERILAAWLLLCAMLATSALVYHLSTPPAATPPYQRVPPAALAAALPDLPRHVRATARPTAGPVAMAGSRAGSLPDSPPFPHPPTRIYTMPSLQPVGYVGRRGLRTAVPARLIEQRAAELASLTVGALPGTAMTLPRQRAAAAIAPVPAAVAATPPTAGPIGTPVAMPPPGTGTIAATDRLGSPGATPKIVYLVVTATPNPGGQYQQAGLQTSLQPTATDQPIATPQPTLVPPTDTPSPGTTQQVWITGYTDQGLTATGMQAGPGICAVDPSYIAMGTRIVIDGVGSCLAEDTGSAVIGPHVDVWVPTDADANAITGWHTASW